MKYPLSRLLQLGREEFKTALDDYFSRLYAETSQEQGVAPADVYDPQLLARFGLPPDAGSREIRQRFRALAMRYHPDRGGESAEFVELVALYDRLKDGSREHGR